MPQPWTTRASSARRTSDGFSLPEVVVAILLSAALCLVVLASTSRASYAAKVARQRQHQIALQRAVDAFQAETGRFPQSLEELLVPAGPPPRHGEQRQLVLLREIPENPLGVWHLSRVTGLVRPLDGPASVAAAHESPPQGNRRSASLYHRLVRWQAVALALAFLLRVLLPLIVTAWVALNMAVGTAAASLVPSGPRWNSLKGDAWRLVLGARSCSVSGLQDLIRHEYLLARVSTAIVDALTGRLIGDMHRQSLRDGPDSPVHGAPAAIAEFDRLTEEWDRHRAARRRAVQSAARRGTVGIILFVTAVSGILGTYACGIRHASLAEAALPVLLIVNALWFALTVRP